jgi:hypothetical protein
MILVTTPGNVRTRSHSAAHSRSCSPATRTTSPGCGPRFQPRNGYLTASVGFPPLRGQQGAVPGSLGAPHQRLRSWRIEHSRAIASVWLFDRATERVSDGQSERRVEPALCRFRGDEASVARWVRSRASGWWNDGG